VGHRWQGIPANAAEKPAIETRVVKFADLGRELPRGVRTVTAAERAAQLRARQKGYDRRFIDS
jgi:hypothetical protein